MATDCDNHTQCTHTLYGALSRGKWSGHEANYSSPCSAKVKNGCSCTSATSVCLHDLDRENYTLIFFTIALKAGFCMESSLVMCEVNICCFKSVVQRDGSDTVLFSFAALFYSLLESQSRCGHCCGEKGLYEFWDFYTFVKIHRLWRFISYFSWVTTVWNLV